MDWERMDWKIVYKVQLKSTWFKPLKETKQNYIPLFLYSSLSSAVKKKKGKSKVSYLYLCNISLPLVCSLSLNYFLPLISSSVSWRSRTAQISGQVQLYWQDSNKPWKIFTYFICFLFFFYSFLTNMLQSSDCLLPFLRWNKYNNPQLVQLRNLETMIMK